MDIARKARANRHLPAQNHKEPFLDKKTEQAIDNTDFSTNNHIRGK